MTLSRAEERNQIRLNRRQKIKKVFSVAGWTLGTGALIVWLWHWTGG
ncbi:hypothetical protein [Paenibacillus thermotolerans]|nr:MULTISPECIES: hypothetical protein [unclassified Paenibacillus]